MFRNKELKKISKELNSLGTLRLDQLKIDNTVIVNFGYDEDTINTLEHQALIDNAMYVNETLREYKKIFFVREDNEELEIIEEFNSFKDEKTILVPKNSSNAFVSPGFSRWLEYNKNDIRNYVITGCSLHTDVLQFALTLKAFFDEWNALSEVIIPVNSVKSTGINNKEKELIELAAFYLLRNSAITLVADIK